MSRRIISLMVAGCLVAAPVGCADEVPGAPPTEQAAEPDTPAADAATTAPSEEAAAVEPRARLRTTRAELRTYDGAPPVTPHVLDEYKEDCMFCHRRPLSAGGVWSPKMSHPYRSQCEQCHVHVVPAGLGGIEGGPPVTANRFEPLRYGRGVRTTPGSPPSIPHPVTVMRQGCSSCHGVADDETVRPEHYRRSQCTQCHVPDAEIDMLAAMDAPDLPVAEAQR